jgi:hypothetical protein
LPLRPSPFASIGDRRIGACGPLRLRCCRRGPREGHDDPRRYGAQTSNLWSTRVLGVRLLLRGGVGGFLRASSPCCAYPLPLSFPCGCLSARALLPAAASRGHGFDPRPPIPRGSTQRVRTRTNRERESESSCVCSATTREQNDGEPPNVLEHIRTHEALAQRSHPHTPALRASPKMTKLIRDLT